MKLLNLEIQNFRGLNFAHNFSDNQFNVITGVNGSGKSTIVDAIELLLTKKANSIQEYIAKQVTGDAAILDLTVGIDEAEISSIAERIKKSQPNSGDIEAIMKQLTSTIFINGKYQHRIEIDRAILGWSVRAGSVREFVNGSQITDVQYGYDKLVSQQIFPIISQETLLRFDQLDSMSLSFSNFQNQTYSLSHIFSRSDNNEMQRISRMNFNASPLFNALIEYDTPNYEEFDNLLHEYNELLSPLMVERGDESGDIVNVVLSRDGKNKYPIDSASSGQKKALALVTLKYLWDRASIKPIVLIDEPENSLHPLLTQKAFTSIKKMLGSDGTEPSFIIATHSPEVVAALPQNTYRIINTGGKSVLTKVSGLDDRALVLNELGVNFHLDYVAQKIVFVESQTNSKKMTDAEVYQRLIDPNKESVLFVLAEGGFKQVDAKAGFVEQLFEKLKSSSPNLIMKLKDRDDNEYNPDEHTPFRHMEYIFVYSQSILKQAIESVVGKECSDRFDELFSSDEMCSMLAQEQYKDVWQKTGRDLRLSSENQKEIQEYILDTLRDSPEERSQEIKELIERYTT